MKNKSFFLNLILLLLFKFSVFCQQTNFLPAGRYETILDFVNRKPVVNNLFEAKEFANTHVCKIKNDQGKLEKKAFAVSDGKDFYISAVGMNENLINEDWVILSGRNWAYSKAIYSNESLMYFENDDVTKSFAVIGIGIVRLRGIVYQKSTSKFRVLKTNEDVTNFLKQEKPELLGKYNLIENKVVDIDLVRKIMIDVFSSS